MPYIRIQMIGDYSHMVQERFKKLVYNKVQTDFKDQLQYIDMTKVDRMIDNGATLKEIIIRIRENIAVELLKSKNHPGDPSSF